MIILPGTDNLDLSGDEESKDGLVELKGKSDNLIVIVPTYSGATSVRFTIRSESRVNDVIR